MGCEERLIEPQGLRKERERNERKRRKKERFEKPSVMETHGISYAVLPSYRFESSSVPRRRPSP